MYLKKPYFSNLTNSRAEIHQIVFLENVRHQKVILKLTDLYLTCMNIQDATAVPSIIVPKENPKF